MSYALLWIETIALALIWMAALLAVVAHFRSRLWYALAVLGIVLVPLLPVGGMATLLVVARLHDVYRNSALAYCVSQTIVLAIGMCIIWRRARRLTSTPASGDVYVPPNSAGGDTGGTCHGRAAAGWPRGRLLLTLLMAAALWIMTAWNIELAARAQLAALRQEAGAMMLSVVPPVTNDAQNAAFLYEKAYRRLDADPDLKENKGENILTQDHPDLADPAVARFLARHIETLSLIQQAVQLPDCYFEHNYIHPDIFLQLPELTKPRQVARLLQLHRRFETAAGRLGSAIDDTNAMFRVADHAGRAPTLVNALVSIAVESMAVKNVEELLPALTSQQQVVRLKLDDPDRIARVMRRGLVGEEAAGIATFSDLIDGRLDVASLTNTAAFNGPTPASTGGAFVRLALLGNDVDDYRETMASFRGLLAKPFYEIQPELRNLDHRILHARGFLTTILMPGLTPCLSKSAQLAAELECARLAVLATDYRIAKGELPPTLQSLMPDYLTELPLDPFDGKPLRMKRTADELVIYSIGPDLKDDGGMEFDKRTQKGDLTFTLKVK